MSFVFLFFAVVVVLGYSLISGEMKSTSIVLIYLGVALNLIGGFFFMVFGEGSALQYFLLEEFNFATRLAFISYGCLISGLLLSVVNLFKHHEKK